MALDHRFAGGRIVPMAQHMASGIVVGRPTHTRQFIRSLVRPFAHCLMLAG